MLRIALASLLALLSLPLRAACPLGRFDAPPSYPHGTILALADFNRDGHLDTLTAFPDVSAVYVNFGTPVGTFRRGPAIDVLFPTQRMPMQWDAATGDFNEDGATDAVIAKNSVGALELLLGRGDGTFQRGPAIPYSRVARTITAADFDGDGHLDLAAGDFEARLVETFAGRGDGTFTAPVAIAAGAGPTDLTAGDFNGDRRDDLLVARPDNVIELHLSQTNRAFAAARELRISRAPWGMVVRDVDGDGKLDITIGDISAFLVSIFHGNGDGTFRARVDYKAGGFTEGVAFGEFTGDGRADIVAGNSVLGTIIILPALADGTFGAPVSYDAGYNLWDVHVADVNGDGLDDVLADDRASYTVLLQTPDRALERVRVYGSGSVVYDIAAADFDSDGTPDLAVAAFSRAGVAVFFGNGDGTLRPGTTLEVGLDPISIQAVDLNADGRRDLVLGIRGGVSVALGTGDGRFLPAVQTPLSFIRYVTSTGDVDGDGDIDVLAHDRLVNEIEILLNDGKGALTQIGRVRTKHAPSRAVLADVNGDGIADLATTEDPLINSSRATGLLAVRLGDGKGGFGEPREYAVSTEPSGIGAADFDHDGRIDLAVANFDLDGSVQLFRGNGDGTFRMAATFPAYGQVYDLALHDLDGDGDTDVAFANHGLAFVYENRGGFTFGEARAHVAPSGVSIAAADFNGDGRTDLATSGLKGEVSVQLSVGLCRKRSAP